jgi:hypothetical protein
VLTQQSHAKLWNLFAFRKVYYRGAKNFVKKYAIPIGVNEMTVKRIDESETRYGKRMVTLFLYCKPIPAPYNFSVKDPMSFAPIMCRHVEGQGNIKTFWHPFSRMPHDALDQLRSFKGKKFNGVVKHIQEEMVKDGQVVRDALGKKILMWRQELVSVHPLDVIPEVNYFDLVEYCDNDIRVTDEFIKSLR